MSEVPSFTLNSAFPVWARTAPARARATGSARDLRIAGVASSTVSSASTARPRISAMKAAVSKFSGVRQEMTSSARTRSAVMLIRVGDNRSKTRPPSTAYRERSDSQKAAATSAALGSGVLVCACGR